MLVPEQEYGQSRRPCKNYLIFRYSTCANKETNNSKHPSARVRNYGQALFYLKLQLLTRDFHRLSEMIYPQFKSHRQQTAHLKLKMRNQTGCTPQITLISSTQGSW